MSDESNMALGLTAFAIFVMAWAYYQYRLRQKNKSMSAEEILKSWAEFQKEPAVKVKPTLKKATTRSKTMPLVKSAKPAAFKKNIATSVKEGKPVKQAVAIAYSEAKAAKKTKKGKK